MYLKHELKSHATTTSTGDPAQQHSSMCWEKRGVQAPGRTACTASRPRRLAAASLHTHWCVLYREA